MTVPNETPARPTSVRSRGAVVSTHYDDLSVKRTIEIALGMQPTYLYDALAAPMWDAFTGKPDLAPYTPYDIPEPLMEERNTARSPVWPSMIVAPSSAYGTIAPSVRFVAPVTTVFGAPAP